MCLFSRNKKLIASRKYFYLYTNSFVYFSSFKEGKSVLILDIVNDKTAPDFKIVNTVTKEEKILENPSSGTYKYNLLANTKYKIIIKSSGAIGSYKISVEKK